MDEKSATETSARGKLSVDSYFATQQKQYPVVWQKTDVDIADEGSGAKLFTQKGVEFPSYFSHLARKIISSRYFYGENGTDEREGSFKQLVDRVVGTISQWGVEQGYFNERTAEIFRQEQEAIAIGQKAAFNSPVWFNVGTDKYPSRRSHDKKEGYIIQNGVAVPIPIGQDHLYPQTSACFIQSVDDTMESIMDLARKEAMLFKHGSGTGTDLSTLRSSREKLSGGGKPSGPLAYLTFYDKVAGIVQSGGKTRRAAKMNSLRVEHPDIMDFIEAKSREEDKIFMLMAAGVPWREAQNTVAFQNANLSVRLSDKFMRAVLADGDWQTTPVHNKDMTDQMPKYKARDILKKIAQGTWRCGDPGVQFHDTINSWNTCSNSYEIKASNPCSEYMAVNDSSCNLASQNLRAFINSDGTFNVGDFRKSIRLTAIAQDLLYDHSSFPTKEIAQNSHDFRPLGMGYANLGAALMSWGLPYDSDEARAVAASITALMTGAVYETSTEMAEKVGTFAKFEENKKPMMGIMQRHKDCLKTIDKTKIPTGLENILDEAEKVWENVIARGEQYGFRNSQATVLAPTGTIGRQMDCATLGIEPEIGLVQTKILAEGGSLRIVNSTVPLALQNLGYTAVGIEAITDYINKHETIEGCGILAQVHLPIFDCSNKPKGAKRTISPEGHIKMMAAVQPFLSGAISKTVNMPQEATPENIYDTYIQAWQMGLKAVAIYRDGSKGSQPMNFSKREKEGGLETKTESAPKPVRRKLPITANSIRHKFDVVGHEGYMHIGLYDDGTPGELFIEMSKEGSTVGGLMAAIGTLISLDLQYGVPLAQIVKKLKGQRFEPHGIVYEGHPKIKTAESLVDYFAQFMEKHFLENGSNGKKDNGDKKEEVVVVESKAESAKTTEEKSEFDSLNDAELGGFCPICGKQMKKKGKCQQVCRCGYESYAGCGS